MINNYTTLNSSDTTRFKKTWKEKFLFLVSFVLFSVLGVQAQVTVTGDGAGSYTDLQTALAALPATLTQNTVVDLASGNPQTAPAGGYSISTTGTASFSLTITGNGNTVTGSAALTAGSLTDAIFKIIGGDYITIQNFVMQENALNLTTAAATNNMTEFGVALFYASTTNGAQNCTVQNNTISLNRTYQNTFGIYSNSTHAATAPTTSATATTAAGGNSGLRVYGNAISNVNNGILVVGPTAGADANTGIDIGGASALTGNTLTNYGTTGTFSGFANVSGTVYGILVRNSAGYNISYNALTSSNGGVTVGTLRGIYNPSGSNAPIGTLVNSINNNTIALTFGVATGTLQGITVESTTGNATSTQNINGNNFTTLTGAVATSATITAISCGMANLNTNITNNTFSSITTNTTGSFTFITNSITVPAGGSQTISNNAVTAFNKTGAGGTVTGITSSGSSTTITQNWSNNNFSNITVTGATTLTFINNTDGGSVNHNIVGNLINSVTGGTSTVTGINSSFGGGNGGSGNLVSNNTITNITSGGTISAITIGSSGTSSTVSGNVISGLTSTGASAVQAITSAAPTSNSIFRNKIYDLSSSNASGTVNGILISGGTLHNVYNNIIGDLRAPAANAANPLNGINITGGTTSNVYFNTVYLNASSSGALFGSSAISVSTTPNVTLRNNIFVNNSTFNGAAFATAYRRGGTTLTSYNAASNNNLFYTAAPTHLYYDGTLNRDYPTYAALVASRDSGSFTSNPTFLSTTGSNADFLHIDPTVGTQLESGGATIAGITTDFDGDTRNVSTPDIGADEFAGTSPAPQLTAFTTSPSANQCTATARLVSVTATTPSGTILSVTLNYAFNGVAQPSIPMTNTSGNIWEATIPAATPENAVVTWSVTAQNTPLLLVTNASSGTSYQDSPLADATIDITPTTPQICGGSGSITLTSSFNKNTLVTVGAGATTSSSTAASFFPGAWGGAKTQYIIRASELTAAGLSSGSLYSLAFDVTAVGQTYQGFRVQLGHTNATSMTTTFLTDPLTQVYLGTLADDGYLPTLGINTLVFGTGAGSSSSFVWNGTSNIVVSICWSRVPSASTSTSSTMRVDATGFTSSAYDQTDNATPAAECATLVGDGTGSNRPQFKFMANLPPAVQSISWSDGTNEVGTSSSLIVSPSADTTYTVTYVSGGCSKAKSVIVDITTTPTAPTATGSVQCGPATPTASVTSTSGIPTPTFKWYADNSTTTALQTGTSSTFTSSVSETTTFFVSEANGICESPRTPVTVTVNTPPTLTVTGQSIFCGTGGNGTLTAASDDPNITFVWSTLNPDNSTVISNINGVLSYNITATSIFRVVGTPSNLLCSPITVDYSVSVYPLPVTTLTGPDGVCPGSPATITSDLAVGNFSVACITPNATLSTPAADAVTLANNGVLGSVALSSGSLDDGYWNARPIGFSFNYFGTTYTTINIGTNGTINFGASGTTTYSFPGGFPSASSPANTIAVCARDLQLGATGGNLGFGTGGLRYWTEGTAPNRRFIVQYDNATTYFSANANDGTNSVEAVLYETTGLVDIRVIKASNPASTSTSTLLPDSKKKFIGLQDGTRTIGATAPNCTTNAANFWNGVTDEILTPLAWRFTPPSNYTTTWSKKDSTTAGAFQPITGAIGTTNQFTLTTGNLTEPTEFSLSYTNTTTGCTNAPGSTQIAINILGTTSPASTAVASVPVLCLGTGNSVLTLTGAVNSLGSSSGLTYQWQVSTEGGPFANVASGGTAATYTATPTVTSTYQCLVSACGGTAVASSPVTITVNVPGTISIAANTAVCTGGSTVLTATTLTGTINSYVWSPETDLSLPLNEASVTVTPSATRSYSVYGIDSNNCQTPTVSTTVTVNPYPAAVSVTANAALPFINNTICNGAIVELTATGGGGAPTYVWSTNPVTPLYTDSGATNLYTTGNFAVLYAKPTVATTFTATVTELGCPTPGSVLVGVTPLPVFTVAPITICKGNTGTLTVTSAQDNTYNWSPAGVAGATSGPSLQVNPLVTTDYYVTATSNTTTPACSSAPTLVTVTVSDPGAIVTQPVNSIASTGNGTTFTVAGSAGVTYTYQWQIRTSAAPAPDGTWANLVTSANYTGVDTATLNVLLAGSGTAINNARYRCILTPPSPCATLTSNVALLTVSTTGIVSGPDNLSVCLPTSTAQFSVVTNGTEPFNAQWLVNAAGGTPTTSLNLYNQSTGAYTGPNTTLVPGLTFAHPIDIITGLPNIKVLTISGINSTSYNNLKLRVTLNNFLQSAIVTLSVNNPVDITTDVSTDVVKVCKVTKITNFSIATSGTVGSIEWKYATSAAGPYNTLAANIPLGTTYANANTNSLSVTTTASTPVGNYFYKAFVTGAGSGAGKCPDDVSQAAQIEVVSPTITVTPSSTVYCSPGTGVTLTAGGSDISNYLWSSSPVGFASTDASVVVSPAVATTYTVTGTDSNGCINTASQAITVGGSFTLAVTPATPTSVCEGSAVTLGVTPTQTTSSGYLINTVPYQFTASSGTFTPLVGAINSSVAATADFGMSSTITPGFTFNYGGINYTTFRVSSDGALVFGGSGTATGTNNLATTTSTQRPGFTPLWDDLQCREGVKYLVQGSAPNRVLTVEWLNMEWNFGANAAVISYQAKLYETTNAIEFIYRQESAAVNNGSATIGLMGTASSNFISLQDTSANPTISTSSSANAINTKPATGQVYRFTPVTPITYTYAWTSTPPSFSSSNAAPSTIPTGTTTYTVEATSAQGCKAQATTAEVSVVPTPAVITTNDGAPSATRCGTGKVTLTATATAGASLNWYANATGGIPLYTGTNFLTPDLSLPTSYWVEAAVIAGLPSSKDLGLGAATSSSPGASPFYHGYGGQKAQYIIRAADLTASGFSAGNLSSLAFDITSLGTSTLNGFSISIGTTTQTAAVSNTAITGLSSVYSNPAQSLNLGVNNYPFSSPFFWDGSSNLVVQVSYSNNNSGGSTSTVRTDTASYTSTLGIYADNATSEAVLAATSSTGLGSLSSNTTTTARPKMIFGFNAACIGSSRTQVNAVVTQAPALALSSAASTICDQESTETVTITPSTVGNYANYTWSPSDSVTGSAATGYVFSPLATTVYTLTATEAGGCINTATHTVTVNPNPSVPVLTPITPICAGSDLNLIAVSGAPTILSQNFESGLGDWTVTAASSGGANTAVANFNVKAHGSTNSGTTLVTFNSPGGNNFLLADPDGAGSGVVLNTQLTSPSFSTVGYTAVSLSFRHYHRYLTTAPTVQISTDGGTIWTNVASYTADQGTSSSFATATVSLNAYIGQSNVKVRYNYTGGWIWYWAIDDIAITGTPAALSYSWSGPNGFNSLVQNPTITGATTAASGTYTLEVTNIFGCKSQETVDALVYPTPTAVAPANQGYFNGLATAAIPLSGTPSGVTFDISGGASVGLLDVNGVTAIPSFTAQTGTATVGITPKANGCTGTTVYYNIVVSAVTADPIANQEYCEGVTTAAIPLTSTPSTLTGVTYTILGGADVGLADVSGVTSIPSFIPIPGSATITVIPQYGGVSGGAVFGTILVNPLPTATIAGTTQVCQNDAAPTVTFTGANGTAPYTFTYKLNGGGNQTIVSSGNTATIAQPTGTAGTFTYTLVSVQDSSSTACSNAQAGTATIIVHPTPTAVAPANQSYYSGFATAAIPLTGTPSGVTFNISGGAAAGLADVNGVTAIPSFIPTTTPATVTITPVANGCVGLPVTYQIAFNPVVVNITSNACGSINHGLNNQIQANSVSVPGYTTTGYQFEVTNTATGEVAIVFSSQSHFKLTDSNNYAYGTTFTIRVAAVLNGQVQGYFGSTCSLTTASVQTSRVVTAQCGSTLVFINSTINANSVGSTNLYRFRVALASAPTVTYLVERTVPNFKLTDVVGLPLLYNTEYLVDVQIRVKLAGFEAWSQYGVRCSVFTPAAPETSLIASQCGEEAYLVPSTTSPMNAIAFPGASAYRFRLTGYDGFGDVNYQQEVTNAAPSFTLSQFTGLTPATTYTVSVAMELFGTFTDYTKDCSIVTPAITKQVVVEPFKATAYPNPFAANFMIDVKTASTAVITIKVYDMVGRLVEQKTVAVTDLKTSPIGNNYPSGVYNVVVTQEETVQTLRVVKR